MKEDQLFKKSVARSCCSDVVSGLGASQPLKKRREIIMTEYWKSVPRKFCDFCKCWLTDNRPSIDFHEKGKKHQENVKRKLSEVGKKGEKEFKAQKKMDKDMAKIEKAAIAAFKKDIAADPSMASQYGIELPCTKTDVDAKPPVSSCNSASVNNCNSQNSAPVSNIKKKKKIEENIKNWYEAKSLEGYTYYWNVSTQESRWEPPDEEYITLEEQALPIESKASSSSETVTNPELDKKFEYYKKLVDEEKKNDEFVDAPSCNTPVLGPIAKPDPYGKWTIIKSNDDSPTDLELPKVEKEVMEVKIPKSEDRFKFKEKIFKGSSVENNSETVTFKKRKNNASFKRNIRRRDDDD